jgi:nuclear mRNA export protein SAC3
MRHRKYRILDDCSRLRDIAKSFPPQRHFLPSLLVLSWADVQQAKSPSDFIEMVRFAVAKPITR